MAAVLESCVNHTVSVITADGRNIVGTLKGFDQTINIILDESHERVYSTSQGVEQVVLGLYIIRGDNIAVIGEVDEDLDSRKLVACPCKKHRPLPAMDALNPTKYHTEVIKNEIFLVNFPGSVLDMDVYCLSTLVRFYCRVLS